MNNFWDLVKFEYKKIFIKRSAWIALILYSSLIVFSCFGTIIGGEYIDGEFYESNYDSMKTDRKYERALAGKEINTDLIMKTSKAYQPVLAEKSVHYSNTQEYQTYARPYSSIYYVIRCIYNKTYVSEFEYQELQKITPKIASSLYDYRSEKIRDTVENYPVSDNEKEKIIALDKQVTKPFMFEYFEGYRRFIVLMYTTGLLSAFLVVFLISPIFCGEYQGCDQLILSSRNGKDSLIKSKMFTGFSITAVVAIVGTLLTYLPCMLIYGFDGKNAALQLDIPLSTLPITIGQWGFICFVCVFFACILMGAFTMFLSAKLKYSFVVISITSGFIILSMFGSCPDAMLFLYRIHLLLPIKMMEPELMIEPLGYNVFGSFIQTYIAMPVFALFVSVILMPLAYKNFKHHQVV